MGQAFFIGLLVFSSILILFPAAINFKYSKEKNKEKLLLFSAVAGAILAGFNSYVSNDTAMKNQHKAAINDSLYKDLLRKNADTAVGIIRLQRESLDLTRAVLDSSRAIFELQNLFNGLQDKASQNLTRQLDSTSRILSFSRETIKYILGDSSFPVMEAKIGVDADGGKTMIIQYVNKSLVPIYDLKIVLPKYEIPPAGYSFIQNEINIGTLTKNYIPVVFSKKMSDSAKTFGLTPIGTVWRNGYYVSFVYFHRNQDGDVSIEIHHYNRNGEFEFINNEVKMIKKKK